MHELMVRCERCGQELMVNGVDSEGNRLTDIDYISREHRHGHMIVCDVCKAELGYTGP